MIFDIMVLDSLPNRGIGCLEYTTGTSVTALRVRRELCMCIKPAVARWTIKTQYLE